MQAEAQRLPRISAAYSFIAAPPGPALQAPPPPLHPAPYINTRRSTLKPGANPLQVCSYPLLLFMSQRLCMQVK